MDNIKKTVTGMLIAGFAFGISAFTTIKNRAVIRYYKTDMTYPGVNDARGYQYFSDDRCETIGNLCSTMWDIGTNQLPIDGDALPITGITFQTGSVITGHFE